MERRRGFTLVEMVIAIFILLLLLGMAVPSLLGVMADRRLRRTFDRFNDMVRLAHERSIAEQRAYQISWTQDDVILTPAVYNAGESHFPAAQLAIARSDHWNLDLPAALSKNVGGEWMFWGSGVCEPAEIRFSGHDGTWTASYAPLNALAQIKAYAPR